ncbi:MAG: phosphotransferase [Gammaproteobacteria bacterium]
MTARATIPADPVLPQLSAVLDSERMAKEFARRLCEHGPENVRSDPGRFRVVACEIGRIKYKAGARCSIGYRLRLRDRDSGAQHEQLLCGRIYERGGSRPRYEKAQAQPHCLPRFGPPVFHVESLDMVVWAFPNDRKLNGLRLLTDEDRLRRKLVPGIVASSWGADWKVHDLTHSVASYVPEGRCCVRVDVLLVNRVTKEQRPWSMYGKTHYDDSRNARAYRLLDLLWNSDGSHCGTICTPRPLAHMAQLQLYWQEAVAGQARLELRADTAARAALLQSAGRGVARFHGVRIDCDDVVEVDDVVDRLRETATSLRDVVRSNGVDPVNAVNRLIERAPRDDRAALTTLHGDLHPKNIFFDGERVSLIDLDDVCKGPPAFDVGSLFARVLGQAILDRARPASAYPTMRKFYESYCLHCAAPVSPSEVSWYTAAALINERALRSWTRLDAQWRDMNDEIIRLVEQINRSDADAFGLTSCVAA